MTAESDAAAVAAALPSYEVGAELGRGGWGVVLSGRHRQLDRKVAIKQLPPSFAADEAVRSRFFVEARLTAALDHPHIVPVYDFVEQDGLCLLVMEQLPGGTVWSGFTSHGFTPQAAAATTLACLAGLQAAHAKGVLHRDIKPENLMFSANGVLKVTDFGMAKMVGGENVLATRAGEVIGTPAYIAPEQAKGAEVSPATDIYSVATMLYELLSGALPFADDGDTMALLFKHAFEPPQNLSEKAPQTPALITEVVMSGLATDPAERPATAEQFGLALARACTSAWGPGWLSAEALPVMGARSFVAATESAAAASPQTAAPVTGAGAPARPTQMAPVAVTDIPPPPGAPTPSPLPPTAPTVHPRVTVHTSGLALADVGEPVADLVPLQDVVVPPPSARWPFLAASALLILTVVLALTGLGSPTRGGTLPANVVTVNAVDPTTGHTTTIDLSKPVPVTVAASAPQADLVKLGLEALGQQVSSATATLTPGATSNASIDLGGHYFIGGAFTGKVTLLNHGTVVATESFPALTSQSAFLSASGIVPVVILLFVIAYAESLARTLRRKKRSASSLVGLTVIGGIFGLDVVAISWVVTKHEPVTVGLIVCALLGAGTGFATALGASRLGRQRRFQRAQRNKQPKPARVAGA